MMAPETVDPSRLVSGRFAGHAHTADAVHVVGTWDGQVASGAGRSYRRVVRLPAAGFHPAAGFALHVDAVAKAARGRNVPVRLGAGGARTGWVVADKAHAGDLCLVVSAEAAAHLKGAVGASFGRDGRLLAVCLFPELPPAPAPAPDGIVTFSTDNPEGAMTQRRPPRPPAGGKPGRRPDQTPLPARFTDPNTSGTGGPVPRYPGAGRAGGGAPGRTADITPTPKPAAAETPAISERQRLFGADAARQAAGGQNPPSWVDDFRPPTRPERS
jgi:hypothetical protein